MVIGLGTDNRETCNPSALLDGQIATPTPMPAITTAALATNRARDARGLTTAAGLRGAPWRSAR